MRCTGASSLNSLPCALLTTVTPIGGGHSLSCTRHCIHAYQKDSAYLFKSL